MVFGRIGRLGWERGRSRREAVVIFGYYGRGNLGDETILAGLLKMLRDEGQTELTVISADPAGTAEKHRVAVIPKFGLWRMLCAFRKSRMLVGGGGSLFQDQTSLRSLCYYSGLVILARICGTKVFLYGQGVGPIRSRIGRLIARNALNQAGWLTIRDRLSLIIGVELGVSRPELHLTADPLFALEPVDPEAMGRFWRNKPRGGWRLGIVLRNSERFTPGWWARFIRLCLRQEDVALYLLTTDTTDRQFAKDLAVGSKAELLPADRDWRELQAAVAGLDLVVSARLHGLVAAVSQGIPAVGLADDSKLEGFCSQTNIPCHLVNEAEAGEVAALEILNRRQAESGEGNRPDLPYWRARALENQALLREALKLR